MCDALVMQSQNSSNNKSDMSLVRVTLIKKRFLLSEEVRSAIPPEEGAM